MPIRFFSEGINFKIKRPRKIRSWIEASAKKEGKKISDINYVFCDDGFLLRINKEFLHHDTLTDIITFDNSDIIGVLSGEVYISVIRVAENSKKYKSNPEEELMRVMIHGILHLCDYRDKKVKEEALMRKKEAEYLSLWKDSFTWNTLP